jgi:hypothetical protein
MIPDEKIDREVKVLGIFCLNFKDQVLIRGKVDAELSLVVIAFLVGVSIAVRQINETVYHAILCNMHHTQEVSETPYCDRLTYIVLGLVVSTRMMNSHLQGLI